MIGEAVNRAPQLGNGRDDGPGLEHLRWHHAVGSGDSGDIAFLGFRSDEGVRRHKGRPGAADGPRHP